MLVPTGASGAVEHDDRSVGGFGHLWNKEWPYVVVRPSRYNLRLMKGKTGFTLSFLGEGRAKSARNMRREVGADTDKAKAAGITPRAFPAGGVDGERVGFEEARIVVSCPQSIRSESRSLLLRRSDDTPPELRQRRPASPLCRAIEGVWKR